MNYQEILKTGKAQAYDVGYTATELKKVYGLAQEGEVAPRHFLGYLTVKSMELQSYADDLQSVIDAISVELERIGEEE